MSNSPNDVIDRLNTLLRCELAAIKSYHLALTTLSSTLYHGTLLQCCRSHEARAERLRQEILARGGTPVTDSAVWSNCTRLLDSGATAAQDMVAICALADGEVCGENDYALELPNLEPDTRGVVESSFIPELRRTQNAISDIRKQVAA